MRKLLSHDYAHEKFSSPLEHGRFTQQTGIQGEPASNGNPYVRNELRTTQPVDQQQHQRNPLIASEPESDRFSLPREPPQQTAFPPSSPELRTEILQDRLSATQQSPVRFASQSSRPRPPPMTMPSTTQAQGASNPGIDLSALWGQRETYYRSPRVEAALARTEHDEWAHIVHERMQKEEELAKQIAYIEEQKKAETRRLLLEQIEEKKARRRKDKQSQEADLMTAQRIEREVEHQKEVDRANEIEKQHAKHQELSEFLALKQQREEYERLEDRLRDQVYLQYEEQRAQEFDLKERAKRDQERRMWQEFTEENVKSQQMKEAALQKEREMDAALMVEYDKRLLAEEAHRKEQLSKIQRTTDARESDSLRIAEERRRHEAEEMEKFLRYQQEREQMLEEQARAKEVERKQNVSQYQKELQEQMAVRQLAQEEHAEQQRRERMALEQKLQAADQEELHKKKMALEAKQRYAEELHQQQMSDAEKRLHAFEMTDTERKLNRHNQTTAIPMNSPTRRDVKKYLSTRPF